MAESRKLAVIGGGPMGLACAYELLKAGYSVDVYEREPELGGMSAHFDFSGIDIEKYYHFVCGPDYPLFDLMRNWESSTSLSGRIPKWAFTITAACTNGAARSSCLPFPRRA